MIAILVADWTCVYLNRAMQLQVTEPNIPECVRLTVRDIYCSSNGHLIFLSTSQCQPHHPTKQSYVDHINYSPWKKITFLTYWNLIKNYGVETRKKCVFHLIPDCHEPLGLVSLTVCLNRGKCRLPPIKQVCGTNLIKYQSNTVWYRT